MKILRSSTFALLTTSAFLALAPTLEAQSRYTWGHGDIGAEYDQAEGAFHAHWHLDAGSYVDGEPLPAGQEFDATELVVGIEHSTVLTNAYVANALGVASGSLVWKGGSDEAEPDFGLGLDLAGVSSGWLNDQITLSLTQVTGPGSFAAVNRGSNPNQTFFASDINKSETENQLWFLLGGDDHAHAHLHWYFSAPGRYELSFHWSGEHLGNPVEGVGTFGVQVGPEAIPEPGAWALLGVGALAFAGLRRYRRG